MASENNEIKALKPDAIAGADLLEKAEQIGVTKAGMPPLKVFLSAILAGAFIAFGAMYFSIVISDASLSFAIQRVLGGVAFTLGLVLVLVAGAELFTGNTLMVCAISSKKITWGATLKNWVIVWLGNLVGSLIAVSLIYIAHIPEMNGGGVAEALVNTAISKTSNEWYVTLAKGILCNIFVCLAVWIGYASRTVVDKVIGVLLPISAFVAAGFEHCVANMFFLPMGFILNLDGVGAAGAVVLAGIAENICLATIGNIIGGSLCVGMMYWFIYHKKATVKA
ncbi:MAG: formate/nitrite transporter family protein [Raoultibacter sp.]